MILIDDEIIPVTPVIVPFLSFGCIIPHNNIRTWIDDEDVKEGEEDGGSVLELDNKEVFSEVSAAIKNSASMLLIGH